MLPLDTWRPQLYPVDRPRHPTTEPQRTFKRYYFHAMATAPLRPNLGLGVSVDQGSHAALGLVAEERNATGVRSVSGDMVFATTVTSPTSSMLRCLNNLTAEYNYAPSALLPD